MASSLTPGQITEHAYQLAHRGDHKAALSLFRRVLRTARADGPLRVAAYSGLGHSLRELAQYAAAERALVSALECARRVHGARSIAVGWAFNDLGVLHKAQGRYADAARRYARCKVILESQLGVDHPDLATLFHNLGGLEHARRRFTRGEPLARRAVELRLRAKPSDPHGVAIDQAALAGILDELHKYDESEPIYRQVIARFEKTLGKGHYEVAVNLNNLAGVRASLGDHRESERLYKRAIAIKRKLFGDDHPEVAITLNNLAMLYRDRGRLPEARRALGDAAAICQRRLGATHPTTRVIVASLGRLA
jgi:tetratricopeptide (TPR) repeat protein